MSFLPRKNVETPKSIEFQCTKMKYLNAVRIFNNSSLKYTFRGGKTSLIFGPENTNLHKYARSIHNYSNSCWSPTNRDNWPRLSRKRLIGQNYVFTRDNDSKYPDRNLRKLFAIVTAKWMNRWFTYYIYEHDFLI